MGYGIYTLFLAIACFWLSSDAEKIYMPGESPPISQYSSELLSGQTPSEAMEARRKIEAFKVAAATKAAAKKAKRQRQKERKRASQEQQNAEDAHAEDVAAEGAVSAVGAESAKEKAAEKQNI